MNYKRYDFEDLLFIMKTLRGKNGCPWDREQNHESLKKYLIEEVYEVIDTINNDDDEFCDELGDLLLQIIFHSQIAKERNAFDVEDVINKICNKLIRRHTHIFGKDVAENSNEVIKTWEEIKKKEKGIDKYTDDLKNVPKTFPNLLRSFEIQKKAAKVGFDWDEVSEAFSKIKEETKELEEVYRTNNFKATEEEIGDLLFAVVNVARFCDVQPELALNNTINKFINRFEYIEKTADSNGKNLNDMTLDEMDKLWNEAKKK
ncbi:MAG: nucleoside triphosphate pyrophosphohydrolase [Clostridiales bacterium]